MGQTERGAEVCFIPLTGPRGGKWRKPQRFIISTRELIHILRNRSSGERQTHHTSSMSLYLTHDTPGRSRATSRQIPHPGEIEFCHPNAAFAEQRQGGSGTAQLPPRGATGGQRQRPEGLPRLSVHAPSPPQQQQKTPACFGGCQQSRRPAPTSCPAQLQAPLQENPLLPGPGSHHPAEVCHVWRLSTSALLGNGWPGWRTASSLRRVISCHRLPVPELWLGPGGSKRSR